MDCSTKGFPFAYVITILMFTYNTKNAKFLEARSEDNLVMI